MLIFSEQDVIQDPPFSRLDLISCRNLLIYLDGMLQKKLIPLFHYALNPGGFLFLGTSESVGDFVEQGREKRVGIEVVVHRDAMPPPEGRGGPVIAQFGPPRPAEPHVNGMGRQEFRDIGVRILRQEGPECGVQG